ncbi:hypothetical protein MUO14_13970 [Halobacillus shinanisalinarum]|uniref:DUF2157 domain-containing protein n=1 Tax=Halobacillus shinanisalinarum TaxID=2932258 RepID=A0ABY4GY09_9BACI|nr:hypothetical protein [Halobacillus shinanisalinarum]UOQ91657.1 hypothetical protein MUO14_13970 [Halobacillus shinanisalinarum]
MHRSRLFVWISFISISLTVGFGLRALELSVDAFYLLLMVFNAVLLVLYHQYKERKRLQLFMKEVPLYTQANLILSTLLMLVLFENELFYSFNLLLTAGLYMAMVFVYKTREYQFVFSTLVAYGIYQLVEHSALETVDFVVYGAAGLLYIGFAYAWRSHTFVSRMFMYMSGLISFFAFIYVSYKGILIQAEDGSLLLFLSYLIVALNYGVLSYLVKQQVFQYLTPVFIFAAAWQLWLVVDSDFASMELFLFAVASAVLLYLGLWAKHHWFLPIKESSFYTSIVIMILCIGFAAQTNQYSETAAMLFTFGVWAYLAFKKSHVKEVMDTAVWVQPLSWFAALVTVYFILVEHIAGLRSVYGETAHFACAGLLLLAISEAFRRAKEEDFSMSTFYIGQSSYALAIFFLLNGTGVEADWMRAVILAAGIAVFTWLVLRSGISQLWIVVSLTVLAFYVSLLPLLELHGLPDILMFMIAAPVLLISIGSLGGKKWPDMNPYFFWLAHGSMVILTAIILLEQTISMRLTPFILMVPIAVYVYSSLVKKREWQVKVFLYASFTTLFFLITNIGGHYDLFQAIPAPYSIMITSVILSLTWLSLPVVWRRRVEWYLIPFSLIGMYSIIYKPDLLQVVEIVPILAYVALTVFFILYRKWSWVNVLPLLAILCMWEEYRMIIDRQVMLVLLMISFVVLVVIGRVMYSHLVEKKKDSIILDSFTWVALLYSPFLFTFLQENTTVWLQIVPYLLLSVWFILNRLRWGTQMAAAIFETLSVLTIYPAYLLVIYEYRDLWSDLIQAELEVLPLIGVMIFLQKQTWSDYRQIMKRIQLSLLLGISAYLVVDAIFSHTIWDAWIIGSLSLISMVVGMQLRIKSYFFVGMGVLIFNVIYQTRPYWGNMPWWVYLLVAGLLLIGIASYNEWQKQQGHNPVGRKLKQLQASLGRWD